MSQNSRLPDVTPWRLARRVGRWTVACARFVARLAFRRLQGPISAHDLGGNLRHLFEEVGGTAVKIGQQLAARSDLLPPEICARLADLNDRVPPMKAELALAEVEQALGRPWQTDFAEFDPNPIGSASVACVFKAALPDGTPVAVKVRRPEVARQFAEDLRVFNLMSRAAEWAGFVRDGSFRPLRHDLAIMFGEELNFLLEARYQRLFRKDVKQAWKNQVTAPRVYSSLCRDRLLVTEFVEGISANHLLAAVESGDRAQLEAYRRDDIDPSEVARRLLMFSLWTRFEAPFFHADPHPGNVLIRPGNLIVLLDFGACGMTSERTSRNHTEVLRQIPRLDASAIADVMLRDIAPLPAVDPDGLRAAVEKNFSRYLWATLDPNADWSERIVASAWLRLLESSRQYQIRMNLDTVRSIRAFLLYDTLAFRLDSTLSTSLIDDYLAKAAARARDAALKPLQESPPEDLEAAARVRAHRSLARLEWIVATLETEISQQTATFQAAIDSVWWALRTGLVLATALALLVLAASLVRLAGVEEASLHAASLAVRPVGLLVSAPMLWWLSRRARQQLSRVQR